MSVAAVAGIATRQSAEVALEGLYERHADRIFGFCRRRLRTRQEAEDAVQNTFLAAMRALQRGTVPVCESAWLFKIAENACIAISRSGARRGERELSSSDVVSHLPTRDGGGDALLGLEDALGAIPENQRRAFVLRELRGLSYAEISSQLGVSIASVETLLYRARRGLARGLESGAGLRGRLSATFQAGSLVSAVKSWVAGLTTVKLVGGAAVVAVAAVAAGSGVSNPVVRPFGSASAPSPRASVDVPAATDTAVRETPLRPKTRRPKTRVSAPQPAVRHASTRPHRDEAVPAPSHEAPTPTPTPAPEPMQAPDRAAPRAPEPLTPKPPVLPPAAVEIPNVSVQIPEVKLPEPPKLPDVPVAVPGVDTSLPPLPPLP